MSTLSLRSCVLGACFATLLVLPLSARGDATSPIASEDLVFLEKDGLVAVEAEHFFKQTAGEKRAFYLTTQGSTPAVKPDGDPAHVAGASGGAYLEVLPDTRRTHADKLIGGENFSPDPGKLAILHYRVLFQTPGRYYVWVRAYSTGSEDNGLHVGINGTWPAAGQRLQWCAGKNSWHWESKQRTDKEHCGEPYKIYLDIEEPGEHLIHFSMREDGFEFDKWLLTTNRELARPEGVGPATAVHAGSLPKAFPFVKPEPKPTPTPPSQSAAQPGRASKALVIPASAFPIEGSGYYLDRDRWLAIDPDVRKEAKAASVFPFPTGSWDVTLEAVGESDGKSTYTLTIGDKALATFECPLSSQMYEEGSAYRRTWKDVAITKGVGITVASAVCSEDGAEHSRARWAAVTFAPADQKTEAAAKPFLAKQAAAVPSRPAATGAGEDARRGSPTTPVSKLPLILPRKPDGDGSVEISGELKKWHKVTLTLDGPYAHEQDNKPNPFVDYEMTVTFRHESGTPAYRVPGYFAADGNAGNTSAESGTQWRVHLAPDKSGVWKYQLELWKGATSVNGSSADRAAVRPFHGKSGSFLVADTDKTGRDLRARGRLQYVGKRYLQCAGTGEFFLKAGADAPETLLGYADFDNTVAGKPGNVPLKTFKPHLRDWSVGDPTWKNGKGKGLIGAVNYLSGKGCNAFSFLTYNAGGDGDNVWPFIHRNDKLHYDCSKLDQWGIVFDHGTAKGMYLHFKMQETEIDDHRGGKKDGVPESLDGGDLGAQRKLYCRELIARFGHNLALNWNLGEENTQSTEQQKAMTEYLAETDPYDHLIVVHTFPNRQDAIYRPLLGDGSLLRGASLQNSHIKDTHSQTVKWVRESTKAGNPWVIAFDESGSAAHGQCPDVGYKGFDGKDRKGKFIYTEHEVRRQTLWGTLMGGGAGVEYYFGYQFIENDLVCEDWRSRDRSWDYCRLALSFFHENKIPFQQMDPADELVGNTRHDNSKYCLAKPGELYLVYLPQGGSTDLDLTRVSGRCTVGWYNPRTGGELQAGPVKVVEGGRKVVISAPGGDEEDWLAIVRAARVP